MEEKQTLITEKVRCQSLSLRIFGIMATLAEFERELIRERTKAGMAAAKRRGIAVGRPRKLTSYQLEQAAGMIGGGQSRADVAALLGVNVATLRRALNAAR